MPGGCSRLSRRRSEAVGGARASTSSDESSGLTGQSRQANFSSRFLEDLRYWTATDRKLALRLLNLVEAIMRNPFAGIGKPEPLKHPGANTWSRRLTDEHRFVYRVHDDRIDFLQGRYHY